MKWNKKLATACIAAMTIATPLSSYAAKTLMFGLEGSLTSPPYLGAKKTAEVLEEVSGGELKMNVYPASQLGSVHDMLEQASVGELDVTMQVFGGMARYIPRLEVLETAYVVRDFEHLQKIFNSNWGNEVKSELIDNFQLRPIDNWYFGSRQTSSNKPLNSYDDFKGLKLRVPNAKALINFAKSAQARPTPVAFAEVYLALQTNAVDGQENPLPTIESMKFYEVQKNIAMTSHVVQDQAIVISDSTWADLSEQEKSWLMKAIKAGGEYNNQLVKEKEQKLIDFFKSEGVKFTYPDLKPFRNAMKEYYADIDKQYGENTVEQLTSL
ncbi:sialic acid-binding periplasmic protein SiaP [Vibrio sp. MACH09]|uniref:sialic acid TRAP transporter substrate-binding protein SiaP n=1 Tax=unclassified Vibrio TaxID=2614977 RepID=UPI0014932E34|nr:MULTISPECIES: sialic acid TRAP transporter substrate-binding protein SiaP [unclassified Vibrio]NOI64980.1 DctP family TRAP transporter solute-binding subunit [Vibrio sp. 99-8-1]GLO62614.1 sialic acid-binding periplasmic protein SiaP [Vibrio sp. MACH09]